MAVHEDTRENPGARPSIKDADPGPELEDNAVNNDTQELSQLVTDRAALEKFHGQVLHAGRDGLDPIATKALHIGLAHLGMEKAQVSNEDFTDINISAEDIGEKLKEIGRKIMELIDRMIEAGKAFAAKIMSGITGVVNEAEALVERVRSGRKGPSNELHDDKTITISSPGILMTDGEFCADDCKSEIEVVKFFQNFWPRYAIEQIKRASKMIGEYDVESGNSDNFKANAEFLGNHPSLVSKIETLILPGNKQIAFKYVALGPELVDAEDAKPAPDKYTMEVRDSTSIVKTLRLNIEHMKALSKLFEAEADVLKEMKNLSQSVMDLENRRGETIFKGARDDLDTISNMVMGLVNRLKPNYDPIVRHLAKVGSARNAVCRQELDARG